MFQGRDHAILLVGVAVGEGHTMHLPRGVVEGRKAQPVGFCQVAVSAGQRPANVGQNSDFDRAGAVFVGGEETLEGGSRRTRLDGVQADQGR